MSDIVPLSIVLMHGSCRHTRLSVPLRELIVGKLKSRGHSVEVMDAKELKWPILEKPYHHYGAYGDTEKPPAYLEEWNQKIIRADAFLLLDGEYNHSPTPGILNLLDHFWGSLYKYKPAAICSYSYSSTAGVRSAYVLRNTVAELGMVSCPTMFAGPSILTLVKDGQFSDPEKNRQFETVVNELEWYAVALKTARAKGLPTIPK